MYVAWASTHDMEETLKMQENVHDIMLNEKIQDLTLCRELSSIVDI